ncbi:unnamed protein product, partial [marine sediment metagenome]
MQHQFCFSVCQVHREIWGNGNTHPRPYVVAPFYLTEKSQASQKR